MAKRRVTEAEIKLWNKVAKTVQPLKEQTVKKRLEVEDFGKLLASHSKNEKIQFRLNTPPRKAAEPQAKATAIQRKLVDREFEKVPKTPLFNKDADRRVRRGQSSVDASIDLHGFTQIAARSALSAFLMHHRFDGAKCVLVITGKGKLGEGIIKKRLLGWLEEPDIRAHVTSYAQAHQKHGGAGAFYVFLRRVNKISS